ncbi:MAG: CapA family protein [Bacteroidaceae bacterium]|nr:CapA family protein [Bacteroidaceae bacterium]
MTRLLSLYSIVGMLTLGCASCHSSNGKFESLFTTSNDTIVPSDSVGLPLDTAHNEATKEQNAQQVISLALTGDVMIGTSYPTPRIPANDAKNVFDDVKELLVNADIAVGNQEGALSDGGKCTKGNGPNSYAFRTPTRLTGNLKDAGYDYLGIANNHANDFGPTGAADTERTLDSLGIAYSGFKGHTPFKIIERAGKKIGCMAFGQNSYSMRNTEYDVLRKTIADAKKAGAELIIVSMHGGAEGKDKRHIPRTGHETFLGEDRGNLREFAHIAIDAGADVVYGHGPHVTRAVEVYKGRFIAYSLGNFATPYGMNLTGISGYAPVVTININGNGEFLDGKIHSFIQQPGVGPRKDASNSVAREMRELTLSDMDDLKIDIDMEGNITKK